MPARDRSRLIEPFVCSVAYGVEQCAANVRPYLRTGFEECLEPTRSKQIGEHPAVQESSEINDVSAEPNTGNVAAVLVAHATVRQVGSLCRGPLRLAHLLTSCSTRSVAFAPASVTANRATALLMSWFAVTSRRASAIVIADASRATDLPTPIASTRSALSC